MDRSPDVPDRAVHSHEQLVEIWSFWKNAVRLGRLFNPPSSTSTTNFITYSNLILLRLVFGCYSIKIGNSKIINGLQMKCNQLWDIITPNSIQSGCISAMVKFWQQEVDYPRKPSSWFLVSPKPHFSKYSENLVELCFQLFHPWVCTNFNLLWNTFVETRFQIQDENTSNQPILGVLEWSHRGCHINERLIKRTSWGPFHLRPLTPIFTEWQDGNWTRNPLPEPPHSIH